MRIERIDVFAFRVPVDTPVATSFGVMRDRPAVFVKLTDRDGAFGWGEIFANWPAAGAEHRARLLIEDISDLALGLVCTAPSDLFHHLTERTYIRALQCGEWGPFQHVIAGLDVALHDLFARCAGVPLRRYLTPAAPDFVPAYASGIPVGIHAQTIPAKRATGHKAFKLKIGFDFDQDLRMLEQATADLLPQEQLFVDANQAWSFDEALRFADRAGGTGLGWLEEPILADRPQAEWVALAEASRIPLAAGENIAGLDKFSAAISSGALAFVQPDIAKWGGVTGCYAVGRLALDAGLAYCPHFLGGGIGLIASAQLLAAVGGPGLLEVDVNPNPLRDAFGASTCKIADGVFQLETMPGLGIERLPDELDQYQTLALSRTART